MSEVAEVNTPLIVKNNHKSINRSPNPETLAAEQKAENRDEPIR